LNQLILVCHDIPIGVCAPFIESGNMLLPLGAPWLSDFLSEAASFPGGAHDDQLDPMFDAIKNVQAAPAPRTQTAAPVPMASPFRRR
jgi:hypothetical protein